MEQVAQGWRAQGEKWQLESWHQDEEISDLPDDEGILDLPDEVCGTLP